MLQRKKKTAFFIAAAAVLLAALLLGVRAADIGRPEWKKAYERTGDKLLSMGTPGVGSVGGEWAVIGLSRAGRLDKDTAQAYLQAADAHVRGIGRDRLDPRKSTENSRLILGITAAGGDPSDIGGQDLLAGLTDLEYLKTQGENGPIWALIALDSGHYAVPEDPGARDPVTREKLVDLLVSMQEPDGGWGLMPGASDTDMTAMALQALAPYLDRPEIVTAADRGVKVLSLLQDEDGGYSAFGSDSSESSAQVIVALTALGLDPAKDERFVKNGVSVLDSLLRFQAEDGFCHTLSLPEYNVMSTEQAYYALAAYDRFCAGKSSLYDMAA